MRMEGNPRESHHPWRSRESKPERTGLSWKQIAFLVAANALIALGISVAVTLTLGRSASAPPAPTPTATVSAIATPVPPAPTPSQATTYTVKAGDSLSAIAFQYGVTVQDLMAANNLTDPDIVFVGQKLTIPVPGSVTAVPTPPPTIAPTGVSTPIPTHTPPTGPDLRIESVQVSPDARDSFAVITNWGMWARLKGWTLDDGQGNVYTFPDLSLFQGGSVRVHTATGTNTEVDLYWGINKAIFVSGRALTMKDDSGGVRATYTVP
jgi:LysM repeat protein